MCARTPNIHQAKHGLDWSVQCNADTSVLALPLFTLQGKKKKTQTGGWDRGGLSSGWVGVAGGEQSGPPRVREKLSASVELLAVAAVEVRLELLHRLNVHLPHELLEVVLAE